MIKVTYNNREYAFRERDTEGMTQEAVQEAALRTGKLQYEPRMVWLVVPGIGYGWEV